MLCVNMRRGGGRVKQAARDFWTGVTAAEGGGRFRGGWGWPILQFWVAQATPINAIYPVIMHMLTTQYNENKYLAPRAVLSRAALLHVVCGGG
jgi:hypothetical protein